MSLVLFFKFKDFWKHHKVVRAFVILASAVQRTGFEETE